MNNKRDEFLLELGLPIEKEMTYIDWYEISSIENLTENFIREFKNEIVWYLVSMHSKLSEDFIREFQNSVNWDYISKSQKLSEEFIKEFRDKVYWGYISTHQDLSDSFLDEFGAKLYWHTLIKQGKVELKYILEHIGKTDITDIDQINLDRYTSDEINSIKRTLNLKKIYGA